MRIWVTRTAPDAEATAERLRALGHEPLVAPVLKVVEADAAPDLSGASALAFTSRNAVAIFARLSPRRDLPAYAVGQATARALHEIGFADVRSAEGDVDALARRILQDRPSGLILHLGPEEPAGDLAGALAAQGLQARLEAIYRTEVTAPAEALAALAPSPPELDAILVHSPRAARALEAMIEVEQAADFLDAVCISENAAQPLRGTGFRRIVVASAPSEEALLEALGRLAEPPPRPLFSRAYWAAVVFGLLCIVAAAAVAFLVPRLNAARPPHLAPTAAAAK